MNIISEHFLYFFIISFLYRIYKRSLLNFVICTQKLYEENDLYLIMNIMNKFIIIIFLKFYMSNTLSKNLKIDWIIQLTFNYISKFQYSRFLYKIKLI